MLKQAIADYYGLKDSQIFLGNGSDEILAHVFNGLLKKALPLLFPDITYSFYPVFCQLYDIDFEEIPLKDDLSIDLTDYEVPNGGIIFPNPNAPTGRLLAIGEIEYLLKANRNSVVVIDEAYIDFSIEDSWLARLDEFPNVIVTQTLSKAYGLAGIRLGICYASEEIISILNKIKPPYNVNQLTQDVALKALLNTGEVNNQITAITSERNQLIKDLEKLDVVDKVYVSDANFLLVKVDNATLRYNQLLNKGIVVRNRSNQMLCENCLRFTIGTKDENKKLITALKFI